MKKLIKQFLFGKPAHGEPVNYCNRIATKKPVTPFNVSYEIWEQSVKDYGYHDFINWLIKIHK